MINIFNSYPAPVHTDCTSHLFPEQSPTLILYKFFFFNIYFTGLFLIDQLDSLILLLSFSLPIFTKDVTINLL